MLALIPFEAFVTLYRYLCMQCVNVFKIDMNHDCRFDNVNNRNLGLDIPCKSLNKNLNKIATNNN